MSFCRRYIVLALTLCWVPAALNAQTTAKPAPRQAPVQLTPQPRRPILSPEGREIAARIYSTPDPRFAQLSNDLANLKTQRAMLIASQPIDLDQLEALLRKEEGVQAEMRTRINDRVMAILRALPEADLVPMLQSMNPPKSTAPVAPPR